MFLLTTRVVVDQESTLVSGSQQTTYFRARTTKVCNRCTARDMPLLRLLSQCLTHPGERGTGRQPAEERPRTHWEAVRSDSVAGVGPCRS